MKVLLFVTLGGGLGAAARHLLSGQVAGWIGAGFPWGTLAVNLVGSTLLGVFVGASALAWSPSEESRAFLTIGVLGGFTTFSAFSMDVILLVERGRWDHAAGYALASVALAVIGLFLGMRLMRVVFQ